MFLGRGQITLGRGGCPQAPPLSHARYIRLRSCSFTHLLCACLPGSTCEVDSIGTGCVCPCRQHSIVGSGTCTRDSCAPSDERNPCSHRTTTLRSASRSPGHYRWRSWYSGRPDWTSSVRGNENRLRSGRRMSP